MTDLTRWSIGPYHGALPSPMRVTMQLDGEIIVAADIENGFLHRGLEKAFELHPWQVGPVYADRLDPEGVVFAELALCLAVEDIGQIRVPDRAQTIRVAICELARVASHLHYLIRIGQAAGAGTMVHYVLRDREKVMDLFELLTGSRFTLNFFRYGGVVADVTEGFIERVSEFCDTLRIRLKEYNDLFSFNHAFMRRTAFLSVIAPETCLNLGITGPNARASGLPRDVRKDSPYSGYDRFDFYAVTGQGVSGAVGDAHDRFLIRLREIAQSLEILKQAVDGMPKGDFANGRVLREFAVPPGEAYSRVESSRGLLGCYVVADGTFQPVRVQFRVPSVASLALAPQLLVGVRLEDLPLILAGLDLSLSEVDR